MLCLVSHRLRLLISFGCTKLAAEGFFKSQEDVMRKVMLSVSATGDIFTYIDDITVMFFNKIHETSDAFLNLFTGQSDTDIDTIKSLILQWCVEQLSNYVAVLSKQLHLVVNEYTASAVMMMRSRSMAGNSFGDDNSTGNDNDDEDDFENDRNVENFNENDDDDDDNDEMFDYDTYINNKASSYKKMSPMRFVRRVISSAFRHSKEAEGLNLQAAFGLLLQHEIGKLINQFADNMIMELKAQVTQEHWSYISERYVLSYLWVANAVDYLVKEFSLLLHVKNSHNNNVGNSNSLAYGRSDFCGVESTAAAATLRLLLAFMIEVESVSVPDMISDQIVAYIETLHRISDELIPTVYSSLTQSFFIEDATVFGNKCDVQSVLQTLSKRCEATIHFAEGKLNSY